jgi:hypothetical protein
LADQPNFNPNEPIGVVRASAVYPSRAFLQFLQRKPVATSFDRLPSPQQAGAGARYFITDGLAAGFRDIVTGGGDVAMPVYSDGANWRAG